MRILIVTHFFPPVNAVASLRPYGWAKYWSRSGHEVVVLTSTKPPSAHPLSVSLDEFKVIEVPSLYNKLGPLIKGKATDGIFQQQPQGKAGNAPVRGSLRSRFLGYFQHRFGVLWNMRMPDHMDFWVLPAVRAAKGLGRFDLVVSTYGPYSSHIIACLVKRSQGCTWIADYRDLWTDSYVYPGLWPFTALERVLERHLLDSADLITMASPLEADILRDAYGHQVEVVVNGFDTEDLASLPPERIFPKDGKVRLVYTGGLYAGRRDPTQLFKAIRELEGTHAGLAEKLEVVFAGTNHVGLDKAIEATGVKHYISRPGFVNRQDALRMQRDADALLVFESDSPKKSMLPAKVFEYVFSGRPVLLVGAGPDTPAGRLLTETGCGVCLGTDASRTAAVLGDLLDGRPLPLDPSAAALTPYTRKALAERMLSLLTEKNQTAL